MLSTPTKENRTVFMTTTLDNVRTYAGDKALGMTAEQADFDVKDRNERARTLGIKARYKVADFISLNLKGDAR